MMPCLAYHVARTSLLPHGPVILRRPCPLSCRASYSRRIACAGAQKGSKVAEVEQQEAQSQYDAALLEYLDAIGGEQEQGIARGADADEVLRVAAEALHEHVQGVEGVQWCLEILQKAFQGQRLDNDGSPVLRKELPTVDMVNNRVRALYDLGLSKEAAVDTLTRSPRLLGYQSKQLQAMGAYLTGQCGLCHADVAILLQKEPQLLTYSFKGTVPPSLDYLRSLGIKGGALSTLLLRLPRILSRSGDKSLRSAVFFLSEIGYSGADIPRLVVQQPRWLECKPERYDPIISLMKAMGISEKVALRTVFRYPTITTWTLDSVSRRLQRFAQLTDPPLDLDRLFRHGDMFRLSPETAKKPVGWLRASLRLSDADVKSLLERYPRVLSRSKDALGEKLACFKDKGFTQEDFKYILCRYPGVTTLSFKDNICPKLQLLQMQGYPGKPLTRAEVRQLVTCQPSCLGLSPANIVAKLDYLIHVLRRDARELLLRPTYLLHSLEGRIAPRSAYIREIGAGQPNSLSSLVNPTDDIFCTRLGKRIDDYEKFKASQAWKRDIDTHWQSG